MADKNNEEKKKKNPPPAAKSVKRRKKKGPPAAVKIPAGKPLAHKLGMQELLLILALVSC